MDIVARAVLAMSLIACGIVIAIPLFFGLNLYSVLGSGVVAALSVYFLFFANTVFRPNSYRTLLTRWAKDVDKEKPHQEYPRPQLVREQWINLNGAWEYAIQDKTKSAPSEFDGDIVVPFPIESHLSGVEKRVKPNQKLWYRKIFLIPENNINLEKSETLLLHFGAVDWQAELWINGEKVGEHKGGHNAFHFDIKPYLTESAEQEILVAVWDPTNKGVQPRGKQVLRPGNIYYTPVTGIWQSVWLEPLAKSYIEQVNVVSDIDEKEITLTLDVKHKSLSDSFEIEVFDKNVSLLTLAHTEDVVKIKLPKDRVKLWDCDSPNLYDISIKLLQNGVEVDSVKSYFSLRKIEIKKDSKGVNRLFLNSEAVFQLGLLDQGWWPDGLYSAPTDEALLYDIEVSQSMGFNMIRKHVKVEPARWYYHCDRLGMLVWQDMPTGDKNILPKQKDIVRSEESEAIFQQELDVMIQQLKFFQCIVCWVPFNEGWGQFKTNEVLQKVKDLDPTRLVDGPSGWVDRGEGDMRDYHIYNRKLFVGNLEEKRALVIGEFGGIGNRLKEHMAVTNSWSYNNTKSVEHLASRYEDLYQEQLLPLLESGLSAVVYTQTTDVESEINGLITYDREVTKIPADKLSKVHESVYKAFKDCV